MTLQLWNATHKGLLVGSKHIPPAQEAIAMLPAEQEVMLKRDPNNKFDTNAVQVLVAHAAFGPRAIEKLRAQTGAPSPLPDPIPLGFIARAEAAVIAPIMDRLAADNKPVTRALLTSDSIVHVDLDGRPR